MAAPPRSSAQSAGLPASDTAPVDPRRAAPPARGLPGPLFLRPASYRRRRLRDAARLLPFVGGFLMLLPVLWAPQATFRRDTASDGIYLFAVWAGLIVAAALIARFLAIPGDDDDPDPGPDQDPQR